MIVSCTIKSQLLRDYIHSIFVFEDNAFSVFRTEEFGKYLCSMIKYSQDPVPLLEGDEVVKFRMPKTSHYPRMYREFIYLDEDANKKIEDMLDVLFRVDFKMYYYNGKELGLQQKIIIQNFIIAKGLVSTIGDIETLKKRQYRSEARRIKQLASNLARRVQYQNNAIQQTIKVFNKSLSLK